MKISQSLVRIVTVGSAVLPWFLRRRLLNLMGHEIDHSSSIGLSVVAADRIRLGPRARIGHLNVIKGMDELFLGDSSRIGHINWITGRPSRDRVLFPNSPDRRPRLEMGDHASITGRHFIDCCDAVTVGRFTVIAGAGSQIFSHGIDVDANCQRTGPVRIGAYCYVGSRCVLLKSSSLPDFCVLGANSTLHRRYDEQYGLYSGVPAVLVRKIDVSARFFSRPVGRVD